MTLPLAITFAVAGRLDTRTGGSLYNRRMIEALRERGVQVDVIELDRSFPDPDPDALRAAASALSRQPAGRIVLVDGLAFGAMPEVAESEADRLRLVALVHLPLAAAVGLEPAMVARFESSERQALSAARLVIVTGTGTPALMAAHGLGHARVKVVEPGATRAKPARGSGSDEVHLLTVGTISRGKGQAILLEALAAVPNRRWRLACAGSLKRDPDAVRTVAGTIDRLGLGRHVSLLGEQDDAQLEACYDRSDGFVLASRLETYGMAVAEALARSLPVVATATGAIPTLIGDDAGIVVPPGDLRALTAALSRLIDDDGARARFRAGALRRREQLPDWQHAAASMVSALESV